jgi:hypothetical protein
MEEDRGVSRELEMTGRNHCKGNAPILVGSHEIPYFT